ncbi:ral guanine nucleotide dissociation stimulator-like 1 [Diretmus argenteus]
MRKWELTMNPVQEWGEEFEEGAVYGVTLRREPVPSSPSETKPCCAFVQYRTSKVRRLKAATLELLVHHLLDPGCQEPDYGRIFLSTYRTFTSISTLIELLFQRDSATSELDNSECYRSPLLGVVQTWLDEYSEDFRDPPLHPALRLLLDHLRISSAVNHNIRSQPNFCSLAGQAEALLKRFQRKEAETNIGFSPADLEPDEDGSGSEYEDSPDQGGIMDFSIVAIAEQLTRLDSALFVRVVPYQCLGCVWSQRDKKENMSPTIRATIAQFNAITNCVITSLLCTPAASTSSPTSARRLPAMPTQRARVIEKWIRVAQECRQLKNFSSLRAILSALQSNAVYRLRKTWAAVSRDSMATFDNLWETFPDENCVLTNREILVEDGGQPAVDNISPKISKRCPIPRQMSTSSGVVPYLGTYLTVLTMLDTALPDTMEGGLINFEKRRREFEILSQIRLLQASCTQYNLPHHPRIAAWLQGHTLLTDQESYELSRRLEPPVDLCSPPPRGHRTLTKKLSFLLTVGEGSKKLLADQISVSSSGSSGSEMEDLSSPNSACSIRLQSFSNSCNNVSEAFSSPSGSSSTSPCSSAVSSPDSPTPSSASSSSQPDLCTPAASFGGAQPEALLASQHKRSVSMTNLPVYNRQAADSCIVRVSVDLGSNNGNMYKSILLTSQDKTAQVIQRALEKHHLEHMMSQDFILIQVISQDRELLIPDKANVFYAMSTTANFDFVLRQSAKRQKKPLRATSSLGRYTR